MHTQRLHGAAPFWVVKKGAGSAGLAPAVVRWNSIACALCVFWRYLILGPGFSLEMFLEFVFSDASLGFQSRVMNGVFWDVAHMFTHAPNPHWTTGTWGELDLPIR